MRNETRKDLVPQILFRAKIKAQGIPDESECAATTRVITRDGVSSEGKFALNCLHLEVLQGRIMDS